MEDRFPVPLVSPVRHFQTNMGRLKKVQLHIGTDIAPVSNHSAVGIFEAVSCSVEYLGSQHSLNGEFNYYVRLSLGLDDAGYAVLGEHCYFIDIFSDEAPSGLANIMVPAGTYTIGKEGETAAGTFTPDYTIYIYDDMDSHREFYIVDGSLTVSYSGTNMVLKGTLIDDVGRTHTVSFTGVPSIPDYTARSSFDSRNPKFVKVINAKPMARKIAKR